MDYKIRKYIIWLLPVILIMAPLGAVGQADAMLSHYFDVPSYYNAGAIGLTDNVSIKAGGRLQWLGIENAPKAILGTANAPFKIAGKKIAAGVVLQQQTEGLYSHLNLGAQLGYKFKILKGELTAGVQVGFIDEGFKGSKVVIPDNDDYHQGTDEAIPNTDVHGTGLDLGVGLFYQHPKFWVGASCTHVNSPTIKFEGENGAALGGTDGEGEAVKNFEFKADRTVYFMAGSNIPIKNTLFEVIPSVMVMSNFTFTTGEITARIRYNKFLSAGVGYRYNDAVTALLAAEFKGFYIGYSYDYSTTAIARASSGSHEVVIGYNLKLDFSEKNKNRHKNIRIM